MERFFASRILLPFALGLFAALYPASVQAQSAAAGQGVMGAGQHAPLISQPFPPELTSEQQRLRDEAMKRVKHGRYLIVPISAGSNGEGNNLDAKRWRNALDALLAA